jgi:hypothetical protein
MQKTRKNFTFRLIFASEITEFNFLIFIISTFFIFSRIFSSYFIFSAHLNFSLLFNFPHATDRGNFFGSFSCKNRFAEIKPLKALAKVLPNCDVNSMTAAQKLRRTPVDDFHQHTEKLTREWESEFHFLSRFNFLFFGEALSTLMSIYLLINDYHCQ